MSILVYTEIHEPILKERQNILVIFSNFAFKAFVKFISSTLSFFMSFCFFDQILIFHSWHHFISLNLRNAWKKFFTFSEMKKNIFVILNILCFIIYLLLDGRFFLLRKLCDINLDQWLFKIVLVFLITLFFPSLPNVRLRCNHMKRIFITLAELIFRTA